MSSDSFIPDHNLFQELNVTNVQTRRNRLT